jgi:hypothetical protein
VKASGPWKHVLLFPALYLSGYPQNKKEKGRRKRRTSDLP